MSESGRNIWDTLSRFVVILIFVAGLVLAVAIYLPGTEQKQRMLNSIQNREAQIKREEETSKSLISSINTLRGDPKSVERLARDKFGYAKPGETVVRFEEFRTNTIPPR